MAHCICTIFRRVVKGTTCAKLPTRSALDCLPSLTSTFKVFLKPTNSLFFFGNCPLTVYCLTAPPQFEIKYRNQTARRGESAVLACEAKGEKPIGIMWNFNDKRIDPKLNPRFVALSNISLNLRELS